MGLLYAILAISFVVLFLVNIVWIGINFYFWVTHGIQFLLRGENFTQSIIGSTYLKWILLSDTLWLGAIMVFAFKRKHYKTETELHYLIYRPILNPVICVVIPAYNEELVIEKVVKDYVGQKGVKHVIVVDNHSTDNTVNIAERCGAKVVRKESNKGYPHSCYVGFKEALKTDANIIVLSEADGTFNAYDMSKMIPYLDNCDMVVGTRQIQVLSEKGNQNKMSYVWGNLVLAKLLQIKYFSLLHMGIVNLTDVGCAYRGIRKEALEKIINQFTTPGTDEVLINHKSGLLALFVTMLGIKNDLRIIEIPITFKKRIGVSKTESDKKVRAMRYFLSFLWYILIS